MVVCLPAVIARTIASDSRQIYASYEALVGAGARSAARFADDSHRRFVAGALFGSFGDRIIYGALSLTSNVLPTYGEICCRLRPVSVDSRVSFLEENSFPFVEKHRSLAPGKYPLGFRSVWQNRHLLAGAKLGHRLQPSDGPDQWQELLIHSDGKSRAKDDFIEAHLFEGFNVYAIESMEAVKGKNFKREQKNDVKIAMAAFAKHKKANP